MNEITFSIVIPIYNVGRTIEACLSSIFRSNYKNFEVIVVDDHSQDNSVQIAKRFPTKLIQSETNLGAGACRNKGAKLARGKAIVFIDADVIIDEDALGLVVENFEKNPDVSVIQGIYSPESNYRNFTSAYSNLHYHFYGLQIKDQILSTIGTYFVVVKKEAFMKVGGFDVALYGKTTVGEDQMLGYKLSKSGFKILLDKRIMVEHRKHYSAFQYLLHDVETGCWGVKNILKNKDKFMTKAIKTKRMGVLIPLSFVPSVTLSFFIFLSFLTFLIFNNFWTRALFITNVVAFYFLNIKFIFFTLRKKGMWFFIRSCIMTYARMLWCSFGCFKGLFEFMLKKS